ncbi:hypothetical protein [Prevotella nigrescens]|uniref:hypothetical protein n=1 Tax=Prevotella nigrescens TaxID=28133 RepID=UPI001BAD1EB5|nr:hypothetical protein [Prevotella nigrescens]QUB50757.1 hypothetical protein J5A59_02260 [Prevotella nigrescens]
MAYEFDSRTDYKEVCKQMFTDFFVAIKFLKVCFLSLHKFSGHLQNAFLQDTYPTWYNDKMPLRPVHSDGKCPAKQTTL